MMNLKIDKNEKDPFVMYFIARESLNLSPGKLAVQVGHGVEMMFEKILSEYSNLDIYDNILHDYPKKSKFLENYEGWKNSGSRKIVLKANDLQWNSILNEIKDNYGYFLAYEAPFCCYLVIDAGLNEVEPNTETLICFSPARKSQHFQFLKELKLYGKN